MHGTTIRHAFRHKPSATDRARQVCADLTTHARAPPRAHFLPTSEQHVRDNFVCHTRKVCEYIASCYLRSTTKQSVVAQNFPADPVEIKRAPRSHGGSYARSCLTSVEVGHSRQELITSLFSTLRLKSNNFTSSGISIYERRPQPWDCPRFVPHIQISQLSAHDVHLSIKLPPGAAHGGSIMERSHPR